MYGIPVKSMNSKTPQNVQIPHYVVGHNAEKCGQCSPRNTPAGYEHHVEGESENQQQQISPNVKAVMRGLVYYGSVESHGHIQPFGQHKKEEGLEQVWSVIRG